MFRGAAFALIYVKISSGGFMKNILLVSLFLFTNSYSFAASQSTMTCARNAQSVAIQKLEYAISGHSLNSTVETYAKQILAKLRVARLFSSEDTEPLPRVILPQIFRDDSH